MPTYDIPISPELEKLLELPDCSKLQLPMPSPLKIQLPSGGSLNALVDMSKGIPTDCAMSFNLMLQLAPLLVAIECPMRVLKLIDPLIKIVKGLPVPPVEAITEFVEAAADLAPCVLSIAGIPAFVLDILRLIRAVLNCLLGQMRTVSDLMSGLSVRLAAADENPALQAVLQCAQENAQASMQNLTTAIDPIAGVLALVKPIMGIAGMDLDIQLAPPAGPPEDLAAFDAIIDTLQVAVDAIDAVVGS